MVFICDIMEFTVIVTWLLTSTTTTVSAKYRWENRYISGIPHWPCIFWHFLTCLYSIKGFKNRFPHIVDISGTLACCIFVSYQGMALRASNLHNAQEPIPNPFNNDYGNVQVYGIRTWQIFCYCLLSQRVCCGVSGGTAYTRKYNKKQWTVNLWNTTVQGVYYKKDVSEKK